MRPTGRESGGSMLKWQGACRNSAPLVVVVALQGLGRTPYQCQLSCNPFICHPCFCLTRWLGLVVDLRGHATLGSLT
jgi:hypothetical protein